MMGVEGCVCRTQDSGKRCLDGSDCEGSCLYDHVEVVRPARSHCESGGTCTANVALGRLVGKCSPTDDPFGCAARLNEGESDAGLRPLPIRVPVICVD